MEDAAMISAIMEIKVEVFFRKNRIPSELEESKREMFIRLNQRECIVRLYDGKWYLLPMKMKCVSTDEWNAKEGKELINLPQKFTTEHKRFEVLEQQKTANDE